MTATDLHQELSAEEDPRVGYLVVRHAHPDPWPVLVERAVTGICVLRDKAAGHPELVAWEAGRFRKVCLRAKEGEWRRLIEEVVVPDLDADIDERLLFLLPRRRSETKPTLVSRLQVCKWTEEDLADATMAAPPPDNAPVLVVNDAVEMTVGKQLAQAAHAAQLAHMRWPAALREAWCGAGYAVAAGRGDPAVLAARPHALAIRDAGLTEVAPGTLTAAIAL